MMMSEFGQWLIDTAGKLGPLSVAVAVYLANQRQNAWNSGAVVRSSELEDQKLRFALLDRRLTVIQHILAARDRVSPNMKGVEAFGNVLDALREAELVFEDEEQRAINTCLQKVIRYQTRFGRNFEDLDGEELQIGVVEYHSLINMINDVLHQLREAARIKAVAPLTQPGR